MILKSTILVTLMLWLFGCTHTEDELSNTVCGSKDPVHEVQWIRDFTNDMQTGKYGDCRECVMYVEEYESRKVLIVENFPDNCVLCQIRECDGQYVKFEKSEDATRFISNIKKDNAIWEYR